MVVPARFVTREVLVVASVDVLGAAIRGSKIGAGDMTNAPPVIYEVVESTCG